MNLDARRNAQGLRRAVLGAVAAAAVLVAGFGGYLIADRKAQPASQLASLLARGDTKIVPLTGIGSDEAAGRVVVSPGTGQVVIVSDRMPVAEDGRTFELWKRDAAGGLHKAGLFEPDENGRLEVALPVSLDGATGFYVTDEPDGGSPKATTDPLMQAMLE